MQFNPLNGNAPYSIVLLYLMPDIFYLRALAFNGVFVGLINVNISEVNLCLLLHNAYWNLPTIID
jgi:hypothetical protein